MLNNGSSIWGTTPTNSTAMFICTDLLGKVHMCGYEVTYCGIPMKYVIVDDSKEEKELTCETCIHCKKEIEELKEEDYI